MAIVYVGLLGALLWSFCQDKKIARLKKEAEDNYIKAKKALR